MNASRLTIATVTWLMLQTLVSAQIPQQQTGPGAQQPGPPQQNPALPAPPKACGPTTCFVRATRFSFARSRCRRSVSVPSESMATGLLTYRCWAV